MGRGDPKARACTFFSAATTFAGCFVYLYFIHCIMITAGVGQLLDRDTALLLLDTNLECRSRTATAE